MQKTPIRRKRLPPKKSLTPKQNLIKESAVQREKIEKLVFIWQEKLFSQPTVPHLTLQKAVTYLQPRTYAEVVEERVVQAWCGYPLCSKAPQTIQQKYKISLSQRKVFDTTELTNYCSESCFRKSKYYTLQLSEEPVWFRDLHQPSNAHIVSLEEDFEKAVNERRKSLKAGRTNQDIKQGYVQQLIGNVPKNAQENNALEIVEKTTVNIPSAPQVTSFDTLEGYKIEIKNDGKLPTTMVLKKRKEDNKSKLNIQQDQEKEIVVDTANEDDIFNTMMMLKDMSLDKEPIHGSSSKDKSSKIALNNSNNNKSLSNNENRNKNTETLHTENIKLASQDENIQQVQTKPLPKKKKKKGPELSLFGTIWTMLDHMTTKATRIYLNDLEKHQRRLNVMLLLQQENRSLDETSLLRGQIFSERILETYYVIRAQIGIKDNMEDDIVNIIKTFRLSDASMVALDPAQCYMLTLVIVKSLSDITIAKDCTSWRAPFEDCCKAIDQSLDMIIFRKQQQRIEQIEKQRLKDYWKRSAIQHQLNDAIADKQENGLITYPSSIYQPSNSSMTLQNTTSCNSSSGNTSGGSTSSIQHDNRQLVKFWSKKKTSKRLSLVWHWSVSMGYCEYDHGKELNELIKKLTKE
ncbi:hypothetical protein G6F43_008013 [Rhizopus delemar]|nr:hypothetical protein G6F43_008013 [Rhizopus delemar]